MVAPNRELANTLFPFIINPQSSLQETPNTSNQQMDIEVDIPRGRSMLANSNNSRELLIHSNASSMAYADRVQALANCPTWAEQVENSELQSSGPALSYATVREEMNDINMAPVVEAIDPHVINTCTLQGQAALAIINNMSTPQGIEPSVISYSVNQPVDPQLWDSSFCLISLFGMNKYLEDNAKNITCSLYRLVSFIRQRKLKDKTAENIS